MAHPSEAGRCDRCFADELKTQIDAHRQRRTCHGSYHGFCTCDALRHTCMPTLTTFTGGPHVWVNCIVLNRRLGTSQRVTYFSYRHPSTFSFLSLFITLHLSLHTSLLGKRASFLLAPLHTLLTPSSGSTSVSLSLPVSLAPPFSLSLCDVLCWVAVA